MDVDPVLVSDYFASVDDLIFHRLRAFNADDVYVGES
jgi:hypothetical protein